MTNSFLIALLAVVLSILFILPGDSKRPTDSQNPINQIIEEFLNARVERERWRWRMRVALAIILLIVFLFVSGQLEAFLDLTSGTTQPMPGKHIRYLTGAVSATAAPTLHDTLPLIPDAIPPAPLPDLPTKPAPRFNKAERDAILQRHRYPTEHLYNHYIWIDAQDLVTWPLLAERLADFEAVGWHRTGYLDLGRYYTEPDNLSGLYVVLSAPSASQEVALAERTHIERKARLGNIEINGLQLVKIKGFF